MPRQHYRLIVSLRAAKSDTGITLQTWTITADTAAEAVKLAKLYAAGIPSKMLSNALLAESIGRILWRVGD